MTRTASPFDSISGPARRRITRAEYYRMAEVGIIEPDERVELINGELVKMTPISPEHSEPVDRLSEIFAPLALAKRARVRTQQPLAIDDENELQPDLTLVKYAAAGYGRHHPTPADVHLVIEVAHTTQAIDQGVKRELYARAGIGEYWVLDVPGRVLTVYREPLTEASRYASQVDWALDAGHTLACLAFPETEIDLATLG